MNMLTATIEMSKLNPNPKLAKFRERHQNIGAEFHDFQGGLAVQGYQGQTREDLEKALDKGALIELPEREALEVRGNNAARLLHLVLSQDIASMGPGEVCRSSALDRHGKLFQTLTVWRRADDNFLLLCAPGQAQTLSDHLTFHDVTEKLEHSIISSELISLLLFGARIAPLLGLTDHKQPAELHEIGTTEAWSLPYRGLHIPCRELIVPAAMISPLVTELARRGAVLVGTDLYDGVRIEAGLPLWGIDAGPEHFPNEAGFTNTINYSKGCFLGQEIINRIFQVGPRTQLMGIRFNSDTPPSRDLVLENGPALELTSSNWCPRQKFFGGLAIVPSAFARSGSEVTIQGHPGQVVGMLSDLPFSSE